MPEPSRPVANTSPVRLAALRELQTLIENREIRDRLDHSPLAEAKGREHWVLHVLLRALEVQTSHLDTFLGSAYGNLTAHFEALEDRFVRIEQGQASLEAAVASRLESLDGLLTDRITAGMSQATDRISETLAQSLQENLDQKWAPVGESIVAFSEQASALTKGIDDGYRLAAQSRLLLSENARRIADLSRDILALEESVKLVVARAIEQSLQPLEQRIAALEAQNGPGTPDELARKKTTPAVTGD
ncbi:MAG: hypothetical protein L3K03_01750 [Thermoplasmata archaeon]|nr:hypothetical protein [Thermoplasmata archaeon]